MNTAGSGKQIYAAKEPDAKQKEEPIIPGVRAADTPTAKTIATGPIIKKESIAQQRFNEEPINPGIRASDALTAKTIATGPIIKKDEEKKPEVDPIKQVLSELNTDNDDNLIDSFISESKGKPVDEVADRID